MTLTRFVSALVLASCTCSQASESTDWRQLFLSTSQAVRADTPDEDVPANRLFLRASSLLDVSDVEAKKDLDQIAQLTADQDTLVREKASSLLSFVAKMRPNSALALSRYLPRLQELVTDRSRIVQVTALETICYMTPVAPASTYRFLTELIKADDQDLALLAAVGMVRNSERSPEALSIVRSELQNEHNSRARVRIIAAIGSLRPPGRPT